MIAGKGSSKPTARIVVSRLTNPVTAKLKHSAMKPAFKPKYGLRPVSIRSRAIAMPVIIPAKIPEVVTRFQ